MKRYYFITIILLSFGCEEPMEEPLEIFRIQKGKHYSDQRHVESLQSNVLQFKAKFDESARYIFDDQSFQDSKNKLLGFSDCNSLHHVNSARFAWQWFNNRIEIYAYCYINNERTEKFLGTTSPGETLSYRIEMTDDAYVFYFRDNLTVITRESSCKRGIYLMLWPYFGGQLAAPHDITIGITRF